MIKVNVREYKDGDSEKIYSLFSQHTPYIRDEKFWVWTNRMLSDKKSIIIVGEQGGNIVGHYAVIPQKINIDGQTHNVGFAIHAFIHPDYRNGFLIFQITKKMYKVVKEKGIEFIYGFPNKDFRDIQIKADKWKPLSFFNTLEKSFLVEKNNEFKLNIFEENYTTIYNLSEIVDASNEKSSIFIEKNLNYYLNRYVRHPQNLYRNFFILKNDIKVAFICLKIYEEDNEKTGHIIDYVSSENILFKEILDSVENYFYNKVDKMSVWKFSEENKITLLKNDFRETGFETFIGVKILRDNLENRKKLLEFKNWNLCMGDSDAF